MSSYKHRKENDCLNCGHIVERNFCPECGQENIEVKEDALHMVAHAVADYFHFEHKFFGTLKPLLFKPGQLTAAYVAGKRVSFIHPIRLYIFVSIVFFLVVLTYKGGNHEKDKENPVVSTGKKLSPKEKEALVISKTEDVKAVLNRMPISKAIKDSILLATRKEAEKETAQDDGYVSKTNNKFKFGKGLGAKDTTVQAYDKRQLSLPKKERDGFVKHYLVRRIIEVNQYPNPAERFTEDLLHNVPKMMFLLLPLFALILKLVYINKKRYYYEHLIYSFHVHSAIFMSILITIFLQWLTGLIYDVSGWLTFSCLIYIIWYIYRSLRTFYGSSRWITVLKLFFLSFCYNFVFTICFLIIIAVSFARI